VHDIFEDFYLAPGHQSILFHAELRFGGMSLREALDRGAPPRVAVSPQDDGVWPVGRSRNGKNGERFLNKAYSDIRKPDVR